MGSCPTKTPTRLPWKCTIKAVVLDLKGRVSRCALLINRAAVLNLLTVLAHRAHVGLCAVSSSVLGWLIIFPPGQVYPFWAAVHEPPCGQASKHTSKYTFSIGRCPKLTNRVCVLFVLCVLPVVCFFARVFVCLLVCLRACLRACLLLLGLLAIVDGVIHRGVVLGLRMGLWTERSPEALSSACSK